MEICSKKKNSMNSMKCDGVAVSYSYDIYALNFFCEVTLIYLTKMSWFLFVFIIPFSLVVRKGCAMEQVSQYF